MNVAKQRVGFDGTPELWCVSCRKFWPADREHFHACTRNRTGLMGVCKACCAARRAA